MFESDDNVLSRDLYAYFVPDGTAISVESMGEDAGIQASSVIVPEMNVAAVEPRSAAPRKVASIAAAASASQSISVAGESIFAIDMMAPAAAGSDFIGPIASAATSATAADDIIAAATMADLTLEPEVFTFIVNYYKDSIAEDNFIISVEGEGAIGSQIPYTTEFKPEGYDAQPELQGALEVTQNVSENILNVIYQQCFDVVYTVNYYRGSICEDNLIAEEKGEALPYGTVVELPAEALNCQCPKGYAPLEQDVYKRQKQTS